MKMIKKIFLEVDFGVSSVVSSKIMIFDLVVGNFKEKENKGV